MRRSILLVLVVIAAWASTVAAAEKADIPLFAGNELPSPPAQTKPWTQSAPDLPPKLLSATALLFGQGLGDPRGCEYREIRLIAVDFGGDLKVLKTNGWVLPQVQPTNGQRFAVAWNGLIYPVISIGTPADVKADVTAAVSAYEDPRAKVARSWNIGQTDEPETRTVSSETLLPIRAALLLRLGETDLAAKVWKAYGWPGDGPAALGGVVGQPEPVADDPYLMLAEAWAESRWRRAVGAHGRGDDNLSLIDLRELAAFDKAVAKACNKRGIKRDDDASSPATGATAPFLPSLAELPRLLADQERRAAERQKGHRAIAAPDLDQVLKAVNAQYKTPDARVAALIDALQDCADRYVNDGRGNDWFAFNPTVRALAKQGDSAVGPLLRCYESDPRLTRAVGYEGTGVPGVIGVEVAAKAALDQILQKRWFAEPTPDELAAAHTDSRHIIAQQMREYWTKNRGVPLPERWYRILKDDHASAEQWAAAASSLVQPDTDDAVTGGQLYLTDWFALKPDAEGKPQGEPLRSRKDPGVSSLLRQRLRDAEAIEQVPVFLPNSPEDQRATEAESAADTLAQAIASWDGRAAVDQLREYQDYVLNKSRGRRMPKLPRVMWCYKVRFRFNDPTVFDDYSRWVKSRTARQILDGGYEFLSLCEPIWTHPDDPRMGRLADWVFADPRSPWVYRRENPSPNLGPRATEVISSPLLGFPAFRGEALAMLEDKTPVAKLDIRENGKLMSVQSDGKSVPDGDFCPADPKAPKPGTRVEYRRCDEAAVSLSRAAGLPQMQLYWKEADRDAAIARCQEILTRYGDRFRYTKDRPGWVFFGPETAALVLPILDHPATADDVKAGRAVFTLSDVAKGHRVRKWPAFRQPMEAKWITLKTHPRDDSRLSTDPKTGQAIVSVDRSYEQGGTVYQAEEFKTDEEVRRFYGFVGQYDVARVPAEEIEFPAPWNNGWRRLSRGFSCNLKRPGDVFSPDYAKPLPAGTPVLLTLSFWNERGVAQTMPEHLSHMTGGGVSIRPGLTFVAARTLRPPIEFDYPFFVPEEIGSNGSPWQRLAPKPIRPWPANDAALNAATRTLDPAESFDALSIDLRDLFDLSRPGAYWVCVTLDGSLENVGKGISAFATFRIAPPP